ncbi:MAG: RhuM family protein [Candidatus Omnitrophota bacterium]
MKNKDKKKKAGDITTNEQNSQMLIYQAKDGSVKIDVRLENETVWLTQAHLCELFQKSKATISEHVKHIFEEGELVEESAVRNFRTTAADGKSYDVKYYNLDVIISVGYRVKSLQGTQFRIWATQRLREYIVKGFALNDERFKSGNSMNYFAELQERLREIRLSERFFYQKIKDIYTTSIDYDPKDEKSIEFFKVVQNKLQWAISEQTAAELVYRRANAALPLMGMQSYDKKGRVPVRKNDAAIAKNYLNEDEIKLLGLIVEQYLAFAETMALQQKPMYMKDWIKQLDAVIKMNGRELLEHAGTISHKMALEKSEEEYEKYRAKARALEHEESLKELENDIKKISEKKVPGT